jgi:hypothetical protein
MENQILLDTLTKEIGSAKAKKLVRLVKHCDEYLLKFKKDVTPLLAELNKDVKIGMLFTEKELIDDNRI